MIRLTQDHGTYAGAQPYHTVAVLKAAGRAQAVRYTPVLERAEFLFGRFMQDITDPARLRMR